MQTTRALRLAIDIGGTFTDTVLMGGTSQVLATAKTATTPDDPSRSALEGARLVLAEAERDWHDVTGFVHGTTLATNALIERRGAVVASITTEGFRDILEIARERRYSQYAVNIEKPDLIVPRSRAFTISGRMNAQGVELKPLDAAGIDGLVADLQRTRAEAVAICLLHAYANPAHELLLREALLERMPDLVISLSHEVSPEAREFDRLCTTVANAYIQPLMASYLSRFAERFAAGGLSCPILMMTASGGMTTVDTAARLPIRLVESGPAGGAILAARLAEEIGAKDVLSFDMGGTTAKLCLIDDFRPQTARSFEISRAERFLKGSGMPVRIPVIEMIEIGAGGGSIARVDGLGQVRVGPHSAGADPGPAAFCKGGTEATVTDADIALGLIDPAQFAEGRLKVDRTAAESALSRHLGDPLGLPADQSAFALSDIVDETMASAGRMHAVESGKDLGARVMVAFGGNGPLHATRVARRAQARRIVIPNGPGVGSAIGFLFAPVSFEIVRSRYTRLDGFDIADHNAFFEAMVIEAEEVVRLGAPNGELRQRRTAFMRYHGQGHEIEITLPARDLVSADLPDLRAVFEAEYAKQFSRTVPAMAIEVLNWSVSISSGGAAPVTVATTSDPRDAEAEGTRDIYCDVTGQWRPAAVYRRASLGPGHRLSGPALIHEPQTTTFVSADFEAFVDGAGNLLLTRMTEGSAR